ncbi:MAG: hypothetical protein IJX24_00700 [Oscillospiraceae bacterium]|nr:hypothetical protein [Oscillospiraceae bacterium]
MINAEVLHENYFGRKSKAYSGYCSGHIPCILDSCFFVKDVAVTEFYTYSYKEGEITSYSWHNYFNVVSDIIFALVILLLLAQNVICIAMKIRTGEKIAKKVLISCLTAAACTVIILLGDIMVNGLYTKDDYNPEYYEFTDGNHTIVIEEKSFLLYGGGTVYQIKSNEEAVVIGKIRTDDGGRNNGDYEIEWFGDRVEITYNTFASEGDKVTEVAEFK